MTPQDSKAALAYFNGKVNRFVPPDTEAVGSDLLLTQDDHAQGEIEPVSDAVAERWGRLDIFVHPIACCPADDRQGRITEFSQAGFARSIDIAVHSLIQMPRQSEPLMTQGGSIPILAHDNGEKGVDNYNTMGPVKATMRSLAVEIGLNQNLGTTENVGAVAAMLAEDAMRSLSSDTTYVNGGLHVRA